jgi:hypothetical protein
MIPQVTQIDKPQSISPPQSPDRKEAGSSNRAAEPLPEGRGSERTFSPALSSNSNSDKSGSTEMQALQPCERADLHRWADGGGPLPARLANHVITCAGCADFVRQLSEVHAGLTLLSTQTAPPDLHARASARALRFLKRAARATAAAQRLLRMRPQLTPYQRAYIHLSRVSVGAAAAVVMLAMRSGLLTGIERTRQAGEQLAEAHWQRHIDPNGEYLGPHSFT